MFLFCYLTCFASFFFFFVPVRFRFLRFIFLLEVYFSSFCRVSFIFLLYFFFLRLFLVCYLTSFAPLFFVPFNFRFPVFIILLELLIFSLLLTFFFIFYFIFLFLYLFPVYYLYFFCRFFFLFHTCKFSFPKVNFFLLQVLIFLSPFHLSFSLFIPYVFLFASIFPV